MFGNVTALGNAGTEAFSIHAPGMRPGILTSPRVMQPRNHTPSVHERQKQRLAKFLSIAPWDTSHSDYRGTLLIRNTPPVGPYSSPMPRDLWWS
jgi:hypothetical protein